MFNLTLNENELVEISYYKTIEAGDTTKREDFRPRTIIPTYVPKPKHRNVKAIDITELSTEQREEMVNVWNEYQEYLEQRKKTTFSFEDFASHTGHAFPEIKWRTFKPDHIEL